MSKSLSLLVLGGIALLAFWWGRAPEPRSEMPLLPSPAAAGTEVARRSQPELERAGPAEASEDGQRLDLVSERAVAPIERCSLELTLVDAVSGGPVLGLERTGVQVWQLGLAADEVWSAGDRRVYQGPVPDAGLVLDDLAPGTYRVHVEGGRLGSPVPPAFELATARRAVTWPVLPAGPEPMWLELVRPDGLPVSHGEVGRQARGSSYSMVGDQQPDWVEPRALRNPDETLIGLGGGMGGRHSFHSGRSSWPALALESQGYALGELLQDGRALGRTHRFDLRWDERPPLSVRLKPDGHQTFVGVLVDATDLGERLLLPPDIDRAHVVERLRIEVQALPCGVAAGRASSVAWLDVPVRIRLDSEAYEPIDVTWHGSDGPLPVLAVQHRLPTAARD